VSTPEVYDAIGRTYGMTRRPDPRVAAQIATALGDAETVANVGAGTGSYEGASTVLALEPSETMVGQRPPEAAPAVRARAEALPLRDDAVDAVTALLTVHHWTDVAAGLAELRRVARRRVVVLTWDQTVTRRFWLLQEYLPEALPIDDARALRIGDLVAALGGGRVEVVPVPADCTDGFGAAYWRRPEAYLDPVVRAGMSFLAQTGEASLAPGLARLEADLASGRWHERHADLLEADTFDAGYRLVVAEL
jgi:SAM-dependent methyltransferase